MDANQLQEERARKRYRANEIRLGIDFSTKYMIPFIAGLYVGTMDGKNIEMESTTKYALLTAPTVVRVGIDAFLAELSKEMGYMITSNSRLIHEALDETLDEAAQRTGQNYDEVKAIMSRLEEKLANISVTKNAAKAMVKPGIMTTIGYALGYGSAKLF